MKALLTWLVVLAVAACGDHDPLPTPARLGFGAGPGFTQQGTGTSSISGGTNNQGSKFTGATTLGVANFDDDGTTFSMPHGGSAIQCTESTGACTWTGAQTVNGGLDSHAGTTTVGQVIDTIQTFSTTGTINDFALNATTKVLVWTGSGAATLNGIAGCTSGRELEIIAAPGANNALTLAKEAGASTAGFRIYTVGGAGIKLDPNDATASANAVADLKCINDGTNTRWRVTSLMSGTALPLQSFATSSTFAGITMSSSNLLLSTTTGHIRATGTVVVASNCGTGSVMGTSNDIAGHFTAGNTTTCTLTFGATYTNTPSCWVKPEGTATMPVYTLSPTAITITTLIAAGVYDYGCMGLI